MSSTRQHAPLSPRMPSTRIPRVHSTRVSLTQFAPQTPSVAQYDPENPALSPIHTPHWHPLRPQSPAHPPQPRTTLPLPRNPLNANWGLLRRICNNVDSKHKNASQKSAVNNNPVESKPHASVKSPSPAPVLDSAVVHLDSPHNIQSSRPRLRSGKTYAVRKTTLTSSSSGTCTPPAQIRIGSSTSPDLVVNSLVSRTGQHTSSGLRSGKIHSISASIANENQSISLLSPATTAPTTPNAPFARISKRRAPSRASATPTKQGSSLTTAVSSDKPFSRSRTRRTSTSYLSSVRRPDVPEAQPVSNVSPGTQEDVPDVPIGALPKHCRADITSRYEQLPSRKESPVLLPPPPVSLFDYNSDLDIALSDALRSKREERPQKKRRKKPQKKPQRAVNTPVNTRDVARTGATHAQSRDMKSPRLALRKRERVSLEVVELDSPEQLEPASRLKRQRRASKSRDTQLNVIPPPRKSPRQHKPTSKTSLQTSEVRRTTAGTKKVHDGKQTVGNNLPSPLKACNFDEFDSSSNDSDDAAGYGVSAVDEVTKPSRRKASSTANRVTRSSALKAPKPAISKKARGTQKRKTLRKNLDLVLDACDTSNSDKSERGGETDAEEEPGASQGSGSQPIVLSVNAIPKRKRSRSKQNAYPESIRKKMSPHELSVIRVAFVKHYPPPPSNMQAQGRYEQRYGGEMSAAMIRGLWEKELKPWSDRWWKFYINFNEVVRAKKLAKPSDRDPTINNKEAAIWAKEFYTEHGEARIRVVELEDDVATDAPKKKSNE